MNPALDVMWTAAAALGGATITGHEAQYRKEVAEGETANEWTAYSGTLSATTTTLNLPNLEAGATYEAQVRGVSSEEGAGPWSDIGEGTANTSPTVTSGPLQWRHVPCRSHRRLPRGGSGSVGGILRRRGQRHADLYGFRGASRPAERQRVRRSRERRADGNSPNQGSSKVTYTASDPYGGSVTRTVTITITAKTSPEYRRELRRRHSGGSPVTGTPYNNVALSYTLAGKAKDSGLFVIDSASGQISVAQGATLDYETDDAHRETETWNGEVIGKFYRGEVNYTVDGNASVINVNILLTDLEAGAPGAPT